MKPEIVEEIRVKGQLTKVKCICPLCGKEWITLKTNITAKTGYSKSCGCSHALASARSRKVYLLPFEKEIWHRWQSLKHRVKFCYSYVEKGITLCIEWYDFKAFYDWAIIGFDPKLEIDRKDNKLGYSPENCHWVTRLENLRNRDKQTINYDIAYQIKLKLLDGQGKWDLAKEYNCSWEIIHSIYIKKAWKDACEQAENDWLKQTGNTKLPEVVIVKKGKRGNYKPERKYTAEYKRREYQKYAKKPKIF
jgi:hypothetical protein